MEEKQFTKAEMARRIAEKPDRESVEAPAARPAR